MRLVGRGILRGMLRINAGIGQEAKKPDQVSPVGLFVVVRGKAG